RAVVSFARGGESGEPGRRARGGRSGRPSSAARRATRGTSVIRRQRDSQRTPRCVGASRTGPPSAGGVQGMPNPHDLLQYQPDVDSSLELEPPKPADEVVPHEPEKVGGVMLVDAETQQKHAETAQKFLDELLATPLHSPEFQTKLAQLTRLGEGT